jgi:hypothetical protein
MPRRVLLLSLAVVGIAIVATIALNRQRQPPSLPVPEPIAPVELVEAFGLMDGGTKIVRLRDAAGNKFAFCLTHFEDVHGKHRDINNRLFVDAMPPRGRMIELHSVEETRLRQALSLALENQTIHPSSDAPNLDDREEWNVAYAKTTLEWFKTLGEPLP